MLYLALFLINASMTASSVAAYASTGSFASLFGIVFCGFCTLIVGAVAVMDR